MECVVAQCERSETMNRSAVEVVMSDVCEFFLMLI